MYDSFMTAYSKDLRLRVLAALDSGMARRDVVRTFHVSLATLKRYIKQRRETGDVARKRPPGRTAHKAAALRVAIVTRLRAVPDATLQDQCVWWAAQSGVVVSTATMSRAIKRVGWTRKKSRWVPVSETTSSVSSSERALSHEQPAIS
jgi:transposase